jgi:hypothetical protein
MTVTTYTMREEHVLSHLALCTPCECWLHPTVKNAVSYVMAARYVIEAVPDYLPCDGSLVCVAARYVIEAVPDYLPCDGSLVCDGSSVRD